MSIKYKESISGQGYLKFSNFLSLCDINNFKQNENLTYMTEHINNPQLENGIQLEIREEKDLVKVDPFAKTKSSFLWSPNTSVSDPNLVLGALAKECHDLGIEILLNSKISIDNAEMLSNHGVKIFSKCSFSSLNPEVNKP